MIGGSAAVAVMLIVSACGRVDFDDLSGTSSDASTDATTGSGPAHVQSEFSTIGGSMSVDVTFPTACTNGNVIAVAVNWEGGETLATVLDTKNNTYVPLGMAIPGGLSNSQSAYAKNIVGGPLTVSATLSASSTGIEIIVEEISGADLSAPLVSFNGRDQVMPGINTDAVTSGALTFSGSNNLIFAASFNVSGNDTTYTVGTSFTEALAGNKGNSTTFISEYATQIEPATFTIDQTVGDYTTLAMVFKP